MRRARIVALVAVLLLGGCRGGLGAGSGSGGGTPGDGGPGGSGTSVEQQFDDIESTLNSIESEMSDD